jgi:hypothetical protein
MSANGESSTSRMMLPTSLAVVMMSHLYTFTVCSPLELRFMELLQQLIDDLIFQDRFLRDDSRVGPSRQIDEQRQ